MVVDDARAHRHGWSGWVGSGVLRVLHDRNRRVFPIAAGPFRIDEHPLARTSTTPSACSEVRRSNVCFLALSIGFSSAAIAHVAPSDLRLLLLPLLFGRCSVLCLACGLRSRKEQAMYRSERRLHMSARGRARCRLYMHYLRADTLVRSCLWKRSSRVSSSPALSMRWPTHCAMPYTGRWSVSRR